MERQNHKDSFFMEKLENEKKTTGRREDVLIFKRRITVLLQVIGCLIIFSSTLVEEKGYLYKLRDDIEIAGISGGCNRAIFVVVIVRLCIYSYLLQSWSVTASHL